MLSLKDQTGNTPLHYAVRGHRDDMVSLLIHNDVDPGVLNQDGFNAIHLAARENSSSALRVILSDSIISNRSWLIDEQVDDGSTALHFSALNSTSTEDSIQVLLEKGAHPDLANNLGQTPLHLACANGNAFSARSLVKSGASVNCFDLNGNTPLHEVLKCHSTNPKCVSLAQFLVASGASLSSQNTNHESALSLVHDENLAAILASCEPRAVSRAASTHSVNNKSSSTSSPLPVPTNKECQICSEMPINTLVMPCRHRFSCALCLPRMRKCLTCKELITEKLTVPEWCFICDEQPPQVQYAPCGCLICCGACAKLTKKCPKCRTMITGRDFGEKRRSNSLSSRKNNEKNQQANNNAEQPQQQPQIANITHARVSKNQDTALRTLQAKYDELRNRVICVICVDNIINMVFPCGHGVCQLCGDKCTHCPICRKRIDDKILLYCQ